MRSTAVVFGGPSAEHEISVLTGLLVGRILESSGRIVELLYWRPDGSWELVPSGVEARDFSMPRLRRSKRVDFNLPGGFVLSKRFGSRRLDIGHVVNCCHGGAGEGNALCGSLALAGYPCTGPGVEAGNLALDKFATAALAHEVGVACIPTRVDVESVDFDGPWLIKPRFGGSSLNIEFGIEDRDVLQNLSLLPVYRDGYVVQPFLRGWIDLNVAVSPVPRVGVSAIERPLRPDNGILGFEDKYLAGSGGMESAIRELPAVIPPHIRERIEVGATMIVRAMGLSGLPRVDFLWDGAESVLLCEVNSIPGAMGLYLWEAAGYTREEMLEIMIAESVVERVPDHWVSRGDQRALQGARTLAAKLSV